MQKLVQSHKLNTLIIEKDVKKYPWVQETIELCKDAKIKEVEDIRDVIQNHLGKPYPADPEGFYSLLLGKNRGPFIKDCPCSNGSIRCGYYFLHVGVGCPIDCTYCYLQGFIKTSFPILYVNFDDLDKELEEFYQTGKLARMGTGEMIDSLAFEPITGYARRLSQSFERWPNMLLELKTKTTYIDNLLDLDIPNVTLAWSLNPLEVARWEENGAPSPQDRLLAAQKAQRAGYHVGFHFDPIISYPNWQELYYNFLQEMFGYLDVEKIAWISLGTMRIFPQLRDVIRHRHPNSKALFEELIPAYDGKLRYFKSHRIHIYREMMKWIKTLGSEIIPVYLCMESKEVWEKVVSH